MIRRPLNSQFNDAVLSDIKITTIRKKPWPLGLVMLYNWTGRPYWSPPINLCSVEVLRHSPIVIERKKDSITYAHDLELPRPLWHCEGFPNQQCMDDWFAKTIKVGKSVSMHIQLFKR
jgi:hypothetical protein